VRVHGAGRRALLEPDDRVVQQLRDDAPREGLDGVALVGGEGGEVGAEALELRGDDLLAAPAQRPDQRREVFGALRRVKRCSSSATISWRAGYPGGPAARASRVSRSPSSPPA
jgi:hypothetical protein